MAIIITINSELYVEEACMQDRLYYDIVIHPAITSHMKRTTFIDIDNGALRNGQLDFRNCSNWGGSYQAVRFCVTTELSGAH